MKQLLSNAPANEQKWFLIQRIHLHLTYNCSGYGYMGNVRCCAPLLHEEYHGVRDPNHAATHGVHHVQHTLDIL